MPHVVWNESTGAPGDGLFREILEGDGWDQPFIGVEQHEEYRADPTLISDAQFAELVEDYGFTRRDSAEEENVRGTMSAIFEEIFLRGTLGMMKNEVHHLLRILPFSPQNAIYMKRSK